MMELPIGSMLPTGVERAARRFRSPLAASSVAEELPGARGIECEIELDAFFRHFLPGREAAIFLAESAPAGSCDLGVEGSAPRTRRAGAGTSPRVTLSSTGERTIGNVFDRDVETWG